MISDALVFLKSQLNTYLKSGWSPTNSGDDPVKFIDDDKMEPLLFNPNFITMLLINLEEENKLRDPNLYRRVSADGSYQSVQPEIRLNMFVLFVPRHTTYQHALEDLSHIVQYFQGHHLFRHPDALGLSDKIDKLIVELITLPFSEQNEVWNALRATYHPSVLYKVKMLVFRDENAIVLPEIEETILRITT